VLLSKNVERDERRESTGDISGMIYQYLTKLKNLFGKLLV